MKRFDQFSIPVQFSFEGRVKSPSYTGCIITFIMLILLILLAINVSSELWLRQQPNLGTSIYFKQKKLYLQDFPIEIQIINQYNQIQENIQDYLVFTGIIYSLDENFKPNISFRSVNTCDKVFQKYSDIGKSRLQHQESEGTLKSLLCFDFEQGDYIVGDISYPNSSMISITSYFCQGSENCKSKDETKAKLNGFSTNIFFPQTTSINGFNYDHPIQQNPSSAYMLGSFDLYKVMSIQIQNYEFKSDNGIIQQNWKYEEGQQILNKNIDTAFIQPTPEGTKVYTVNVSSSSTVQLTTRVYLKFTESLAKVMGFLTAGYAILYLVLYQFQTFIFHIKLIEKLEQQGIKVIKVKDEIVILKDQQKNQENQDIIESVQSRISSKVELNECQIFNLFLSKFMKNFIKLKISDNQKLLIQYEEAIRNLFCFENIVNILSKVQQFNMTTSFPTVKDIYKEKDVIDSKDIYQSSKVQFIQNKVIKPFQKNAQNDKFDT